MRGLCRLFDAPSQKSGAHQLDQLASAPVVMRRLETFDVGSLCSSTQIPLEKPCVGRRVNGSTSAEETARGSIECSQLRRPPRFQANVAGFSTSRLSMASTVASG